MAKRFEKAKAYTEKYKHLLQPCQYCGNTDVRIASDRTSVIGEGKDGYFVACTTPHCDCTDTFTSVKRAIDKWNSHRYVSKTELMKGCFYEQTENSDGTA